MDKQVVRVAVPGPFLAGLDYICPEHSGNVIGRRVWVTVGRRKLVGIIIADNVKTECDSKKLKPIQSLIDENPLFSLKLMQLLTRVSEYYQAPIGDVYYTALPTQLCEGVALDKKIRGRKAKITEEPKANQAQLTLNPEQATVLNACLKQQDEFCVQLIEGITGSGKTEIYLQIIASVLHAGKQALVLVPEIGLTPQTVERFKARFGEGVVTLHSKLSESEKRMNWYLASSGQAKIVIGTRSAVFTAMSGLGVIVIDEEHDLSFKQQSGVRYSARDVGIMRAKIENIPIVLGSATPSLESLYNVQKGRYNSHYLPNRAGAASVPSYHMIDMRQQPLQAGLSRPLIQAISAHLANKSQVLLFLNRRGYAPVLMCHSCGWTAQCKNCDAYYTLHQQPMHLCCHHCGSSSKVLKACPQCDKSEHLIHVGIGTEQLEAAIIKLFPEHKVLRLDRDSTRHKGSLDTILTSVHDREADIIVGTQMLAKGHHFEGVTMVGIVDMDNGLFSSDFRSIERAGQLLVQVAGRAGRVDKQGQVFIQTHQPEHPLLATLLNAGYREFAKQLLIEREQASWPPFSYLALVRAEALDSNLVFQFLNHIKRLLKEAGLANVLILGPAPALMQKKARHFRGQLLLQSPDRRSLQTALRFMQARMKELEHHKIRWAIDVDPLEMG
ncbi:MAG: primosomal protein N' [Gammaproteobacteria bacterium]|nr:primosomal protein N' [Gammaproteobacteria bacterium]